MLIAAPLWWLAYKLKYYIVLFGASTDSLAPHFLGLQNEIENNDTLLADFPHLTPQLDFKGQFVKWTDDKVKLLSGAAVEARSIHSKFRGLKDEHRRPDVMVCDDPQDEDDVATAFRRQRLIHRFRNTILNLGSHDCDIYVEGNFMHKESLVATYLKDPLWDGKLYRAINIPKGEYEDFPIGNTKEDSSALWPHQWPMERLVERERLIKGRSFALEFLNYDRGAEEIVYDTAQFKRFSLNGRTLKGYQVIAYWDPATGKEKGSGAANERDYAAISVVATRRVKRESGDPLRYYWVLKVYLKRASAEQQIEAALDLMEEYPIRTLYYEDNGGFAIMVPFLKRRAKERGVSLPLKQVSQSKNKVQRILNAEPIIKRRTLFEASLPAHYFSQWSEFPYGSHDDGPDSTVGVLEQFESKKEAFAI
jgi:predicted phage terminase large subunit-like protein